MVRTTAQRQNDTLTLLQAEEDLWIATANGNGTVHLIPLSFSWTGTKLVLATPERSRTVRNLRIADSVRVAIGPTRDVVIVEGRVEISAQDADAQLADFHAQIVGFDAREMDEPWVFISVIPERIQAWRNPAELADREIYGDGSWLR
jgi:general stress protein 26